MGIEEAILHEVEEKGIQKGTQQTKIRGFKKALKRSRLINLSLLATFL